MPKVNIRACGGLQRFLIAAPAECVEVDAIVAWANALPGELLPPVGVHDPWIIIEGAGLTWEIVTMPGGRRAVAWVNAVPLDEWAAAEAQRTLDALRKEGLDKP